MTSFSSLGDYGAYLVSDLVAVPGGRAAYFSLCDVDSSLHDFFFFFFLSALALLPWGPGPSDLPFGRIDRRQTYGS